MENAHPAFGVPVHARVEELPEDTDRATARTIERMRHFANEDSRDLRIVGTARMLGAGKLPNVQFAENVHRWVRDHVRFVQDREIAFSLPPGMVDVFRVSEVLIRPAELIRMADPQGDCDDFSMLTAALLTTGGVDASFATVAANPASPGDYSHVYDVAHLQGGRLALDSSHGEFAGWEAPNTFNKLREWGLSGMSWGMGDLGCACDSDGLGFVSAPSTATSAGINWGAIIQAGIQNGTSILQTVLQKPVYQTGPDGHTTIYAGQSPTVAPPGSVVGAQILPGVDNSTLLLGGLGLLAVMFMFNKK